MHRRIPPLAVAAAAAMALGAAPAQATTASLSADGRYLDVTESSPGEINNVVGKLVRIGGVQYVELFDDRPIQAGNGCVTDDFEITRCTDPAVAVRVSLGGGNDRFTVSEVGTDITFGGGLVIDLGPGNDVYEGRGTNAVAEVHGGDGDDDLRGSRGTDHFFGGPGNDTLNGYEGADDLHGGPGDDTLTGDGPSDSGIFPDVIDGGEGRDQLVDYVFSGDPMYAPPITVTLDGVANDGRAGENDAVSGIEVVKPASAGSFTGDDAANEFIAPQTGPAGVLLGKGGNDVLIAGDANGDVVDGGPGDDLIEGGFGDDKLVGGPGRDIVNGDRKTRCNEYACDLIVAGNDTIDVRDGEVDSVTCGPGIDRVLADADDVVAADCENVERSAPAPGPGPGPAPGGRARVKLLPVKLGAALRQGFRVRVTGATGRVTLKARRGRTVVAKGTARARGGRAVVRMRFTKSARRSLRKARKVTLRVSGAGKTATITIAR